MRMNEWEESLEKVAPGIYARLTRPERNLAGRFFRNWSRALQQRNPGHEPENAVRAARQAYTQTASAFLEISTPFALAGFLMLGIGSSDDSSLIESVGGALVVIWIAFATWLMQRAVQITRYFKKNLGGYPTLFRKSK
jgi:hypothetical protein